MVAMKKTTEEKYFCVQCGKSYHRPPSQVGSYCSLACSTKAKHLLGLFPDKARGKDSPHYKRITKQCDKCGEDIDLKPSVVERSKTGIFYCSKECRENWLTCRACEQRFKVPRRRRETAKFCSKSCADRGVAPAQTYGAIHYRFNRDNPKKERCSNCGSVEKTEWANLDGKYDESRPDSWKELCRSCHVNFDDLGAKRGSAHHKSKLTEEDVLNIRRLHDDGTPNKELADQYSVSSTTISNIVARTTWAWLG